MKAPGQRHPDESKAADHDMVAAPPRPKQMVLVGEENLQAAHGGIAENGWRQKPCDLKRQRHVAAEKRPARFPDEQLQRQVQHVERRPAGTLIGNCRTKAPNAPERQRQRERSGESDESGVIRAQR